VVAKGLELDSSQLLKGSEPKYPIKKMLSKCLPSKFVDRPKTGFNPPLDGIIQKLGPERIREELRHTGKFIATKVVVQVVEDHFKGRKNNTYKIWQLLYFSRWLQLRGVD
jgi:asparagine synthase (glutamine-hydrolysing)